MSVAPQDRDTFFLTAEKAATAHRDGVPLGRRIERFEAEVLRPLHDWCAAHADRVAACYVTVPAAMIKVFMVTRTRQYDFDFGDELAALDRQVWASGWRLQSMQLPAFTHDEFWSFFNPTAALNVYAQPGSAPVVS